MKEFIGACFCDGGTIGTRMRKAKRKFLRIEMLVVRPKYQKQGYMRKMMEYAYRLAEDRGVPVILDTDDRDKASRYEHGTHFAFPESMLKMMVPVGGSLLVGAAFCAGREYPKECRETRKDIDRKLRMVLRKW